MHSKTKSVVIVFPAEGVTQGLDVEDKGNGLFILKEHPLFVDSAKYGDVISCLTLPNGDLEFEEVVDASNFEVLEAVLSLEFLDSAKVSTVLRKVTISGGFWQRDFGGCLTVLFDSSRYDPRPDLESANA